MEPIFSLKKVARTRGRGPESYRLSAPDLTVFPGEKILISGPSGSGKSTLMDLLGLILKPDQAEEFVFRPAPGQVFDLRQAWAEGQSELLAAGRRHLGYVLQTGGLWPFLRVKGNIEAPRRLLGCPDDGFLELLSKRLSLENCLNSFPARISVGERQRAALARALIVRPPLILADEPTAALDPARAEAALDLLVGLTTELNLTLILVSHEPEKALAYGFRHLKIIPGASGPDGREALLCGQGPPSTPIPGDAPGSIAAGIKDAFDARKP